MPLMPKRVKYRKHQRGRIRGNATRGNEVSFGEFGMKQPAMRNKIMHAMIETDRGFTLMASDLPPGMEHAPGRNIAISLSGDDAEVLRGYWKKLSRGGEVTMPLEKQMWGDEFGQCTDKFGISWMVNITESRG